MRRSLLRLMAVLVTLTLVCFLPTGSSAWPAITATVDVDWGMADHSDQFGIPANIIDGDASTYHEVWASRDDYYNPAGLTVTATAKVNFAQAYVDSVRAKFLIEISSLANSANSTDFASWEYTVQIREGSVLTQIGHEALGPVMNPGESWSKLVDTTFPASASIGEIAVTATGYGFESGNDENDVDVAISFYEIQPVDETPPTFTLISEIAPPNASPSFVVEVQDAGSGLSTLTWLDDPYCGDCSHRSMLPDPFIPDTPDPVYVTVYANRAAEPGGYYGVSLTAADAAGKVGHFGKWVDLTPPLCWWAGTNDPGVGWYTIQDRGGALTTSGLAQIEVTSITNVTLDPAGANPDGTGPIPGVVRGSTAEFLVKETVIYPQAYANSRLKITDVAGNETICDPVQFLVIREKGEPETATFTDLTQGMRYVTIKNGTPGLKNVKVEVNGQKFTEAGLKDGEEVRLDLASAMVAGTHNQIAVTGYGKPGGGATIIIADVP